jgi:hypothetical protein
VGGGDVENHMKNPFKHPLGNSAPNPVPRLALEWEGHENQGSRVWSEGLPVDNAHDNGHDNGHDGENGGKGGEQVVNAPAWMGGTFVVGNGKSLWLGAMGNAGNGGNGGRKKGRRGRQGVRAGSLYNGGGGGVGGGSVTGYTPKGYTPQGTPHGSEYYAGMTPHSAKSMADWESEGGEGGATYDAEATRGGGPQGGGPQWNERFWRVGTAGAKEAGKRNRAVVSGHARPDQMTSSDLLGKYRSRAAGKVDPFANPFCDDKHRNDEAMQSSPQRLMKVRGRRGRRRRGGEEGCVCVCVCVLLGCYCVKSGGL